ncbi:MAG: relaxase/mobilization nuclease domain-containing protein, partial [Firmicutes bacterium]|nr:relaxase/mobilization nuclease domain-containing protein [Bacillota bacterium]
MAVTKIWKVKGKAKNAINYADDPDKVIGTMYADDIKDVLNYADNGDKTETHMFTTSLNCTREFAAEEFELTKELFDKHNGLVAVHATQSFEETDISPQEAHEIGVQLARELWGDRFQVIIATHLNTDHVHNHFVINSVSFIDGKKFHLTNYCWHDMAEASD